jgi:diguanylate cyclase (GGDEF)-like protein
MSTTEQNQTLKDLMVFHNVARALTSALDLDSILSAIMKQMEQFFQPETWSLLIVDEQKNDLFYAVAMGLQAEAVRDIRVPMGDGIAGWVAQHGETLIVPEVADDPRFRNSTDPRFAAAPGKLRLRVRSAICLPLRSRQRTLGVIQLFNYRLETLTDYTISFLYVLCDYAAIAIENARAVERIQELTITDDCTGLYNVRHLYKMMELEIDRSRANKTHFSLIFIDLDYFKRANDVHGHLVGSRLLAEVGATLRSLARRGDLSFRYGGDEFIILMPEARKNEAADAARRMHKVLRERLFLQSEHVNLKAPASFGVATYPEDGGSVHEVIRAADTMMYLVKASTRDNVAVAGRGLDQGIRLNPLIG